MLLLKSNLVDPKSLIKKIVHEIQQKDIHTFLFCNRVHFLRFSATSNPLILEVRWWSTFSLSDSTYYNSAIHSLELKKTENAWKSPKRNFLFFLNKNLKKTATIATYKLPVNKGTMLLLLRILMREKERKKACLIVAEYS